MNRLLIPAICMAIIVSGCETAPKPRPTLIASTDPVAIGPETPPEKQGYWSQYSWRCKKDAATCAREAEERRQENRENWRILKKVLGVFGLVIVVIASGSGEKKHGGGGGGAGNPDACNGILNTDPMCKH